MLNLQDDKTYTISSDDKADITLKHLPEAIHIEQNEFGAWQPIIRPCLKHWCVKLQMEK